MNWKEIVFKSLILLSNMNFYFQKHSNQSLKKAKKIILHFAEVHSKLSVSVHFPFFPQQQSIDGVCYFYYKDEQRYRW